MGTFDTNKYGRVFGIILKPGRLMPLGPGSPNPVVQSELNGLTLETAFSREALRDQNIAKCCISAIWLYHNYLDESHQLSQEIETISGSYWHGFMHRREPDYSNAKYWFRRVGSHPIFDSLTTAAKQMVSAEMPASARFLTHQAKWDPFAFIDLCAKAVGSDLEMLCRQIQQKEWELLFDFCYCQAIGRE